MKAFEVSCSVKIDRSEQCHYMAMEDSSYDTSI